MTSTLPVQYNYISVFIMYRMISYPVLTLVCLSSKLTLAIDRVSRYVLVFSASSI